MELHAPDGAHQWTSIGRNKYSHSFQSRVARQFFQVFPRLVISHCAAQMATQKLWVCSPRALHARLAFALKYRSLVSPSPGRDRASAHPVSAYGPPRHDG